MSKQQKVLITGGQGQLATDLIQVFNSSDTVALSHQQLDITQPTDVETALRHHKPNVVINAAAFTDVDKCEDHPVKAKLVNSLGPENLIAVAKQIDARVLQISTDYVFDGKLERPYIESDDTNPQSIYGQTKLQGEQAMRDHDLIVRTSWLCGSHGSNILKTIVALAQSDQPMKFVNDQTGHPSFTHDIAVTIKQLIEIEAQGTFHVTNQGPVSWYEFAYTILEMMGRPAHQVTPITTDQLDPPRPATRPTNSVLNNQALLAAGLTPPPHFRDSLPLLLKEICA
ncbi:MAG: dTDP-4-dehydrorhamnose reductase [Acidimicrobiaceae bacterium]|nr:dTDP-4-dehydrorhamnose reductase [Acidimicrobiaceae bacterium]